MKIFIRAYGSHLMGMGHLYRIKKLVTKLKEQQKCKITLFTKKYNEAINIYKSIDVDDFIEVKKDIPIEDEIVELEKALLNNNDNCINDQLNTSIEIASILTKNIPHSTTLDDLGNGSYLFNNIVNVLYPSKNKPSNEINSYSYMILDDYSQIKKNLKFKKEIKTIFINQGAADTWGAIPDMINDLNLIDIDFKIKVLLGPTFNHFDELAQTLKVNKKQIEITNYTNSVVNLVKDCDLAILGAGNTLFEIASLGIPIIASTREEKELITIDRLVNDNIVFAQKEIYKEGLNSIVTDVINNSKNREAQYRRNRELFNYNGIGKILKLIGGK